MPYFKGHETYVASEKVGETKVQMAFLREVQTRHWQGRNHVQPIKSKKAWFSENSVDLERGCAAERLLNNKHENTILKFNLIRSVLAYFVVNISKSKLFVTSRGRSQHWSIYSRAELWLYVIKIQSLGYIQRLLLISKAGGQHCVYMQDNIFRCFGKS